MIDRNDKEGYVIRIDTEDGLYNHGAFLDEDEKGAKIYVGFDGDDNLMRKFEMFFEEMLEKHQKELWRCNGCGNYYWESADMRSPNCRNCNRSMEKQNIPDEF